MGRLQIERDNKLLAQPQALIDAAARVSNIGSGVNGAATAAAVPTTNVVAAAGDEVSAAIASMFTEYGQEYQALSAQAAAFHDQFVGLLNVGAAQYSAAEAANATPLDALNAAALPWLGRPIIGDGTNGATNAQGVGTKGGDGGLLWGNGGRGGDSTATGAAGGAGGAGGWLFGNGGHGGNGGPSGVTINGTDITILSGGKGGLGGSALFFGSGGDGGTGGAGTPVVIPGTGGLTISLPGNGGEGGSAGLFFGNGGDGGTGVFNGHGGSRGLFGGYNGTS